MIFSYPHGWNKGGVMVTDICPSVTISAFKNDNFLLIDITKTIMSEKEEPNQPMTTIVGSKQANAFRGGVDGIGPSITAASGLGGGMLPLLTNATIQETKTENFINQIRLKEEMKEEKKLNIPEELRGKKFRIRKLTPRECFRLMDVDDKDIDKIQASGISNSSQYKLAGNSIVVNVLYHLFRKLIIETQDESDYPTLF